MPARTLCAITGTCTAQPHSGAPGRACLRQEDDFACRTHPR